MCTRGKENSELLLLLGGLKGSSCTQFVAILFFRSHRDGRTFLIIHLLHHVLVDYFIMNAIKILLLNFSRKLCWCIHTPPPPLSLSISLYVSFSVYASLFLFFCSLSSNSYGSWKCSQCTKLGVEVRERERECVCVCVCVCVHLCCTGQRDRNLFLMLFPCQSGT